MSDLISRKAVIDLINKRIENRVPDGKSLYLRNKEAIDIQFAVEELPTAYDVDKVVERLENKYAFVIPETSKDIVSIVKGGGQ
jgi:hypothetical protein